MGRDGDPWTHEFADVPQLSSALHGQKADIVLALAAVAAQENGIPLIMPRPGSPQARQENVRVRHLVVLAGADDAHVVALPDAYFQAFAGELLRMAFDKSGTCTILQTTWAPDPRAAATWGRDLCLQMNQMVAAAHTEFAKRVRPPVEWINQ